MTELRGVEFEEPEARAGSRGQAGPSGRPACPWGSPTVAISQLRSINDMRHARPFDAANGSSTSFRWMAAPRLRGGGAPVAAAAWRGLAIRGDGESVPHTPILTNGTFSYLL